MRRASLNPGFPSPAIPSESEVRLARESSRLLAACIGRGDTAHLQIDDGNSAPIAVPESALRMFADILAQMAEGNAVTIVPTHAELTTQQAADFLNVSRPHLVSHIDKGAIGHHKVGTHRRIRLPDLLEYQRQTSARSDKAMEDLAQLAEELEMGY